MISEKEFFQNVDQIVTSLKKNKNEKLNKGGWKIDQKTYNFLNEIVEKFKTDTVCEFGSGLSTNLFADNIVKKNINKVYSIEHMQDFEGHPKKYIKKLNIKEKIKFINAPIKLQCPARLPIKTLLSPVLFAIPAPNPDITLQLPPLNAFAVP